MSKATKREIVEEDLVKLLRHFIHNSHRATAKDDVKGHIYTDDCERLFAEDYAYSVIPNLNGELCCHYPYKVFVLEYEKSETKNDPLEVQNGDRYESLLDIEKLKQFFWATRSARCRGRFVVPVILFEGKQICRSGTLATGVEMFGRIGIDFFLSPDSGSTASNSCLEPGKDNPSEWPSHDKIRGHDIKLLKYLNIDYICDLMVEKKKVKYYMRVASSEKVDKENRYSDFCLLSLPYPGCEFFREWKDRAYCGQEVMYDWNLPSIDAALDIPNELYSLVDIDWDSYKEWDLLTLTKNYFKLLITLIRDGSSGLLVHCISGWDRTPLYISLMRLSLWADGAIHQSLKPEEILYLTIAYDWYLFGHCLPDRIEKGEEIFRFCFHFLKFITSDEFSVYPDSRQDIKGQWNLARGKCYKEKEDPASFENKSQDMTADKHQDKSLQDGDSDLLSCSVSQLSESTSPSGAQVFLSEGTQSATYVPHKSSTCTSDDNRNAQMCRSHQMQSSASSSSSSSVVDTSATATTSSPLRCQSSQMLLTCGSCYPDETCSHSFPTSSASHYTPSWFSSPAHTAHISSPATLTHSLSEENVPSRASRLACVRNMFFHAYSIAETSRNGHNSMLETLSDGLRWGTSRMDDR